MLGFSTTVGRLASVVALPIALLAMACSYAKGVPYVVDGRPFPAENLELVQPGMTAGEVREALGEPFETRRSQGTTRWRYFVHERQDETVRYFGMISRQKVLYEGVKEVEITFRNGVVEVVRSDHRAPGAESALERDS